MAIEKTDNNAKKVATGASPVRKILRLVVNEDGRIVFADEGVFDLFGKRALVGQPAGKIMNVMSSKTVNDPANNHEIFFEEGEKQLSVQRNENEAFVLNSRIDVVKASTGEKFAVVSVGAGAVDENPKKARTSSKKFLEGLIIKDKIHRPSFKWGQQVHDVVEVKNRFDDDPARKDLLALRHFLNLSDDLFGMARIDGFVFYRSTPSFERVFGYDEREMAELPFLDLVFQKDRDQVADILTGLIANQVEPTEDDEDEDTIFASRTFECRMKSKEGTVKWVKWTMKFIEGEIYANGRDITLEKNNQIDLKFSQQQLSEAQSIAKLGHWRWEVGETNYDWSDPIYEIFGVGRARFKPTFRNVNSMIHKRDLARLVQQFERAVLEKKEYHLEFRLTRPDGEVRHARCEGKCEVDHKGDVRALFGIIQDITDQTMSERALRQAKEAAEAAYKAKSRFLANMSHELRTPLNAIIGFSEMIQRQLLGPVGNERYLEYVKGIRESGEHLLDLITDILDMSKIEAGKYRLEPEELSLAKVMRMALHMMEGRAEEGRVTLATKCDPDDLKIEADRRALMQILLNVLSNAIKFTREGGKVTLSCEEEGDTGEILIKVTDTGVGIPRMKLQRITRPFEQVANALTRHHEGTGLGLSITKSLVELHGGSLKIESQVGIGTTVIITLPQKAENITFEDGDILDDEMIDFDDGVLGDDDPEARQPIFRRMAAVSSPASALAGGEESTED